MGRPVYPCVRGGRTGWGRGIGDDRGVFYEPRDGHGLPLDPLNAIVVPRPIGWISTVDEAGRVNLAPFSFFNAVAYVPPQVMFATTDAHREGGHKVRGLTPPDDIRHRGLQWNLELGMWEDRDLPPLTDRFAANTEDQRRYAGSQGNVLRLGRAMSLRQMSAAEYRRVKARSDKKIVGPYLPVVIEACQEAELAYEYRHGVTSYDYGGYPLAYRIERV